MSIIQKKLHNTPESKERHSKAMIGRHYQTEESKRRISEAHKGKPLLEETKRKISEANKGRKLTPEQLEKHYNPTGKKHTPESIKKMSSSKMGHPVSEETRKKLSDAQRGIYRSTEHLRNREIIEKHKKACRTPEFRERTAQMNRDRVWSKESLYKMSESMKIVMGTPEARKRQSEGAKNPSPEKRRKMSMMSPIRIAKQHKKDTKPEIILKELIKSLGYKYHTQYPIEGITCADGFVKPKYVFFADGDYWHSKTFNNGKQWEKDRKQDISLLKNGYIVLRFWEHELNKNPQEVKEKIKNTLPSLN